LVWCCVMRENNTCLKEQILVELCQSQKAMSTQELHGLVEKSRRGISYHAVHKAAKKLLGAGVLERQGRGYTISKVWVERVTAQLEAIRHNYLYSNPVHLPGLKEFKGEADTSAFVFENLEEADNYRKQLQWEYLVSKGAKQPFCAMSWHLRSPLFASERALNIMNMATKARSEAFIIVAGSTPIDEWCADYYRGPFVKVQTGIPCAKTCDTMVLGDTVVQLYLPLELKQRIESVYCSVSNVAELNIPEFYKRVYREAHDVKLVVIRNPEIAQQLRRQIMAHFNFDRVAFFDINGTLIDGFIVKLFAEYLTLNGKFNKARWEEMALLRKAQKKGEVAYDRYIARILELYAEGLKGQHVDEVEELARRFVDEGRVPLFRPSRRLFNWVNSYYKIITITKTTEEMVEALQGIFAFDDVIASQLEVKDGKYTGKIKRMVASKAAKAKAFSAWLKSTNMSLKGSLAFGDMWHDFVFMEHVEKPVLLGDLDQKDIAFAKRRKWLIFDRNADAGDIIRALRR